MQILKGQDAQYRKMTETPVLRLTTALAIPTIISMLVTSVYNMGDTYFVSKLGRQASGAVGIVFSLMAVIQAVGFTLGMGSGSLISRLLGAQKTEEASRIASSGFFSSLLAGILIAAGGLCLLDPLISLLGATKTIFPYARDYAFYILLSAPVMMASFVLNNLLRAEGRARFAMVGIATGGILNLFLDPVFIFVFALGIRGAALATALSQCVSFCILLSSFLRKRTSTRLSLRSVSMHARDYLSILKNGLPSFCRQGLASISTVALNRTAAIYGDAAVAAMSVVGKIFMLIFSVALGYGQGYQPVVGYNYGAKKYARVREAFFVVLTVGFGILFVLSAAGFLAAPQLLAAFLPGDTEVIEIGSRALRYQCLACPLLALNVTCNMTFQSIGKAWTSTLLSALRQGIFFLPLIFLLPTMWGLPGLQLTQPVSDVFTFLCCIPFAIRFIRQIRSAM